MNFQKLKEIRQNCKNKMNDFKEKLLMKEFEKKN